MIPSYTISIYKKRSSRLYSLWITAVGDDSRPGTAWEIQQTVTLTTEQTLPKALLATQLMSAATSDKLFRQIADTWLGPVEDDPLDDYAEYASREEGADALHRIYLDRSEMGQ